MSEKKNSNYRYIDDICELCEFAEAYYLNGLNHGDMGCRCINKESSQFGKEIKMNGTCDEWMEWINK